MTHKNNNSIKRWGRNILLLCIPIIMFVSIAMFILHEKYTDGRLPIKDESKYLMYINENVFKEAYNDSNKLLRVVNSSKAYLQFCAIDTIKYQSLFFGKDSLVEKTNESFPEYIKWGRDEDLGLYFSLSRDFVWKGETNFVIVPAWLMAILIDENVLDIEKSKK